MKKHLLSLMVMCMAFICATPASAAITKEYGWFESAAVEWEAVSGATNYNVYVRPVGGTYTRLDKELVRKYADKVVLLDRKILCKGTPDEVYADPDFKRIFGGGEV